jgi:hypothetical protein
VLRIGELPPLVDAPVAVGVALLGDGNAVGVEHPGVELAVEVHLPVLADDGAVLVVNDLVDAAVPVVVALDAAHLAAVVVVDEAIDLAVEVEIERLADHPAAVHDGDDLELAVLVGVDLLGRRGLGVARLVRDLDRSIIPVFG